MKLSHWFAKLTHVSFDLGDDIARAEYIVRVIVLLMGIMMAVFTPIILLINFHDQDALNWFSLSILAAIDFSILLAWGLNQKGLWRYAQHITVLIFLALGFVGVIRYNFGTTFILFFVLVIMLSVIYYPFRLQIVSLVVVLLGSFLLSWLNAKNLELTLTAWIPFSGLLLGVWLLKRFKSTLLEESIRTQTALNSQLQLEIEERKAAEKEIAAVNHQLERRVQERTAQLEASNQELHAISYSLAHDLRAPIRAMIGLHDLIINEQAACMDDNLSEYLDRSIAASARMDSMLEGLLQLLSYSETELCRRPLDLSEIAKAIFQDLATEYNLPADSFSTSPTPTVEGDELLISELLTQLISNAIKFSKTDTPLKLEFGAFGDEEQPVYFFKDDGIGLPTDSVKQIFEPFIRLDPMNERSGRGIGLTIARRIVKLHNGEIWVESDENKGTTFFFTLHTSSAAQNL